MSDHRQLAAELVRALRGKRSQAALSRRLGFSTNVVHAWEHGRRFPSASAFFRLVALERPQALSRLTRLLDRSSPESAPALTEPEGVAALLRTLVGDRTTVSVASALGTDRMTVARWLRGGTEPKCPELLHLVELTTQRLLDVIALFADPRAIPAVADAYAHLQAQRRLAYQRPMSHAVLRAMELSEYSAQPRHDPAFIAARLGMSRDEVDEIVADLERAGQVRAVGERFEVASVMTVDTRADAEANRRLKQHWARLGLSRLGQPTPPPSGFFSYNLFAISDNGYRRARELHVEYYERLRELIAHDEGPTRVVLSNLQLLPLDE